MEKPSKLQRFDKANKHYRPLLRLKSLYDKQVYTQATATHCISANAKHLKILIQFYETYCM